MMFSVNIAQDRFTFHCNARDTKSGFAHDCELYLSNHDNYYKIACGTCYYYNRTWESWRFQSVCLQAVQNAIDQKTDELKAEFKAANNYSRMTTKRANDFLLVQAQNDYLQKLELLKNELKTHCYY